MRIDSQDDWVINNSLTVTSDFVSQSVDSVSDLIEIIEFLILKLVEYGVWLFFFTYSFNPDMLKFYHEEHGQDEVQEVFW